MNERIKELAKQSGLKVDADGDIWPAFHGSVSDGYVKFAELIVRKCANISDEAEPYKSSDLILKHFEIQK